MKKLIYFCFCCLAIGLVALANHSAKKDNLFFIPKGNLAFAIGPGGTGGGKPGCTYKVGGSCPTKCNDVALPDNVCAKAASSYR